MKTSTEQMLLLRRKSMKKIFHSKTLVFLLILSFILLMTSEATPIKKIDDSDKEFEPVVRVKGEQNIPADQKAQFDKLIEEGKRLLQQEMDYEGAIKKFKEAEQMAVSRLEKADALFYLSLGHYANLGEKISKELDETVRKLIEIDYYRELDMRLCSPRYVELFQGIKKDYGVLRVQSKPAGADVYINDSQSPLGKTPFTLGCKAGSVRVKVKRGKKEKKDIFKVVAGKETAPPVYVFKGGTSLLLVAGGIALAGGAGAALLLKGKKGGEEATTGSIQVNSSPTGAKVYLDGTDTGKVTNCTLTDVSPGSHNIKLIKEGYEDYQESVSVVVGQVTIVSTALTKHTIIITSPTGSTIWTQGDEVQIRWQTSGASGSKVNVSSRAGSKRLLSPDRNSLSWFKRTSLLLNRPFRILTTKRKQSQDIDLSRAMGSTSNKSSNYQNAGKEFSLLARSRTDIQTRMRSDKGAREGTRFDIRPSFHPTPHSLQNSRQGFKPLGNENVLTITNVKIELYKGDNLAQTISSSTENDGVYAWTVNQTLGDGSDYRVKISCATDASVYGESGQFKIEPKSITVTKPISSTYWTKGQTADITWTSTGAITDVKIDLYKGASLQQTIVYSAPNNGSYTWGQVTTSLETAAGYKVRISSVTASGVYDESEEFNITHGYEFFSKWGSEGSGDGQFRSPIGIAIDSSGNIYISDQGNHRIQKFTPDGTFLAKWGGYNGNDGQFHFPAGIAVDSLDYIYVADSYNSRIQKFTTDGTFVFKWGSYGNGDGQFYLPIGVAVDSSGFVYVSDWGNHRIQKFTADGTFVSKWGSQGTGDGQFQYPREIAIDISGYVYVPDFNHRIQKFTSDGTFICKWGGQGGEDGQFRNPTDIAIDDSSSIYVADKENYRIQKFTSNGIFVTKWGSYGSGDGQFFGPGAIALDANGYIYVCDVGNHRVEKFRPVNN